MNANSTSQSADADSSPIKGALGGTPTMRSMGPRRSAVCDLQPAFIPIIHSGRATCAPLRLRSAFIPIIRSGLPTGSPYDAVRWTAAVCCLRLFTGFRRDALWASPTMRSVGPRRPAFIPIIHSGLPTGSPYESHQSRYTALVTFASWPAASMARTKDGGMSSFFRDWPMRRPRMTPLLL